MPPKKKKGPEPSPRVAYILGLSIASLGMFLGFVYLASFPLKAYSSLDEREAELDERESAAPIPGDAFYLKGTSSGSGWQAKREQFVEGPAGTLKLSSGEINAWLGSRFRSAASPASEDDKGLTVVPDVPNIGIGGNGDIYLNLSADITGIGMDGNHVLSAKIRYKKGAPPSIKVDQLHISGAPIPFPGLVGGRIVSTIMNAFSSAEEYGVIEQVWSRVEAVEAENGGLTITLGNR